MIRRFRESDGKRLLVEALLQQGIVYGNKELATQLASVAEIIPLIASSVESVSLADHTRYDAAHPEILIVHGAGALDMLEGRKVFAGSQVLGLFEGILGRMVPDLRGLRQAEAAGEDQQEQGADSGDGVPHDERRKEDWLRCLPVWIEGNGRLRSTAHYKISSFPERSIERKGMRRDGRFRNYAGLQATASASS
jgi:hypothetical protein